jgi:hypothetical protein
MSRLIGVALAFVLVASAMLVIAGFLDYIVPLAHRIEAGS